MAAGLATAIESIKIYDLQLWTKLPFTTWVAFNSSTFKKQNNYSYIFEDT